MHLPLLIKDLAVILGVAAVTTFIFRLIKQPVVLGYIVAGIIVGPYTPEVFTVADTDNIKVWAELGVVFLMFSLGLEFSFRRLARVGASAAITGLIQIVAMMVIGAVTAKGLGWSRMDAAFLGCMIAVSSTTIIIKALEELELKSKRFAELVFGILIVEDLAAILMLVALTNIATTSSLGGMDLLMAGGKLAIVVSAWFVIGMFIVPRFVKSVGKYGNDEMLTIVALSLCLGLVGLAAYFEYSIALGAFIMGSIIAETAQAKRIEKLVQPLNHVFGAIFFVSVGMLLDPKVLMENINAVLILSAVIIIGKIFSVTTGAFATGQTVKNSVRTGFSMAQIGEFSFIIASLGITYKAINDKIYPVIVAASLVTTFTTPYFIKASDAFSTSIENKLPPVFREIIDRYGYWIQRVTTGSANRQTLYRNLAKWTVNGIIVIVLFTLSAQKIAPTMANYLETPSHAFFLSWLGAFILGAPSIWAMLSTFKYERSDQNRRYFTQDALLLVSRVLTAFLLGVVSIEFFHAAIAVGMTLVFCAVVFLRVHRTQKAPNQD